MKPTASAILLALAATMAASADEAKAPLADAKQQLQQLQKDETASKSGTGESSLKGALPGLQTTLQGREMLPATVVDPNQNADGRRHKRKDATEKNWLVDGYNRLDPKAVREKKDDRMAADEAKAGDGDEDAEPDDQDELIKVYEKESNSAGATAAQDRKAGAETPADPLAPFLKGWLANSPVRSAALASLPRTGSAGTAESNPDPGLVGPGATPAPGDFQVNLLPENSTGAATDNPYLLNLTLPMLPDMAPPGGPAPAMGGGDLFSNGPMQQPTLNGPVDSLVPPIRPGPLKPPPTPADEDKKYFPQLKRF